MRILRILRTGFLLVLFAQASFPVAAQAPASASGVRPDITWMRGGHSGNSAGVVAVPGGQLLASIGTDDTLKLFRVSDGILLRSVVAFGTKTSSLAVSPDGQIVAVGGSDCNATLTSATSSIKLFLVSDLSLIRTISVDTNPYACVTEVSQLAFSPDGSLLASAGYNGQEPRGRLWRVSDGSLVSDLSYASNGVTYHNLGVVLMAFSPDGRYLATDAAGGLVLYQIADGAVFTFGSSTAGDDVAFSPDGSLIAVTDGAGVRVYATAQACLWFQPCSWPDPTSNGYVAYAPVVMAASGFEAYSTGFSPDGSVLAIAGDSSADVPNNAPFVKLWSVAGWSPLRTFATGGLYGLPSALAFSTDGQSLFTDGNLIRQWRIADGSLIAAIGAYSNQVSHLAFSPNGQVLAAGDSTNTAGQVPLWNAASGALLQTLPQAIQCASTLGAAFSPDSQIVATACSWNGQGDVRLWRVADGALLNTFALAGVSAMAFSPDGQTLALGYSFRGSAELRRVADGALQKSLQFSSSVSVSSLTFSPDGQQIAAGYYGSATVFRIADASAYGMDLTGGPLDTGASGPTGLSAAFSTDGTILYVGGGDATARHPRVVSWRVADGTLVGDSVLGDSSIGTVRTVAFSPDRNFIASGGEDATIRFWRLSDGALISTWNQETGSAIPYQPDRVLGMGTPIALAFSPDGKSVAYSRIDATLVVAADPLADMLSTSTPITTTSTASTTTSTASTITTSTTTSTTTTTTLAGSGTTLNLVTGWNLLGNSAAASIDVATTFGDATKITTVWKWNQAASKWAFYAPSVTPSALTAYAQGKGYDVLASIAPKEGFWVNASTAVSLTGAVANGVTLVESDLAQGWNLLGSADNKTPSQLNQNLMCALHAAGKSIVTAWAWEAQNSNWKFYAPSLEAKGGTALADYIASKSYLPFSTTLSASDGFWLNIGAAGGGNTTTSPSSVQIESIATPTAGDFVQLSAVVRDSAGNVINGQPVSWCTDSPSVATVTPGGLLKALGPGQVKVTAIAGSQSNVFSTSIAANSTVQPGQVLFSFGPEETVFDYATQRCNDGDIPDEPAHPIRLADGSLILFAANSPLNYIFSGGDFNSLQRNCAPVLTSINDPTAQSFKNLQWISGVYRLDNVIHALIHNEYHDPVATTCKPGDTSPGNPCWYNSVTYAASTDNGKTFIQPSNYLVAPAPLRWTPPSVQLSGSSGPIGYSNPTNIVSRGDGYYYAMFGSIPDPASNYGGICVMRTQTLGDASSWRAWDGTGYNLALSNPYTDSTSPTACTIVIQPPGGIGSLTFNSYLQQFMLTFNGCGFLYSLSPDLVTWTPVINFKTGFFPVFLGSSPCAAPAGNLGAEAYLSIVDHASNSVNYEEAGQTPYIYFTRWMSSTSDTPRNLIRQPLILLKSPVSGTNFTPPQMNAGLPPANSVISGTTTLFGWAFDGVGISGVQILLDGAVIGSATLGFNRPDIPKAFPGAPSDSGFQFAFNSNLYANGAHAISAVATNTSGITTTQQSSITINQALDVIPPQGHTLDVPAPNSTVSGAITVVGWAIDNVAISKVNILLDGDVIGTATLGFNRPDIPTGILGTPSNSGFQFPFDSTLYANGTHVIAYVAVDPAGNTTKYETPITIAN